MKIKFNIKIKLKNVTLLISILLAIIFYFGLSKSNASDEITSPKSGYSEFKINKVDENGNPLEDAVFSYFRTRS